MINKRLLRVRALRGDNRDATIRLPFSLWYKIDRVVTHYGGPSSDSAEAVAPMQARDIARILAKRIDDFEVDERDLVLLVAALANEGRGLRLDRTYDIEQGKRYGYSSVN